VKKITGYLGKWSIDEEGTLMAVRVITDEVITKKLTVSESATFGAATKPIGVTLYDEITGAGYCIKVKNGVIVNEAGVCGTAGAAAAAPAETAEASVGTPSTETATTTPTAETAISTTETASTTPVETASSTPIVSSDTTAATH